MLLLPEKTGIINYYYYYYYLVSELVIVLGAGSENYH